jgi:type I restriction enzyme, S subunit
MITKPKTVPELRFPGFEGAWIETPMGDLMSFKNGYNAEKEQYGSGIKFINVLDIIENDFIVHDLIIGSVQIPDRDFKKNEVKYGDILFQRSSETREEVGQANVYLDRGKSATFGGFVIRGRPIREFDPVFFNGMLKTAKPRKDITSRSGGSTRYNIGQESLEAIIISIPTLPEQRKIADFLTAVDGRIGQLSQKKALLEDYKKGLMQQLFTQVLRFKDDHGNDFPEWEEKKYSEIYTFQNTNSYSRDLLTYEGGEVRNIHYGDIHTKFRSNFYLSQEVVPFIKPEVELKRISKDCYCRVGDLVIADASEDYADVGKCIEIMELGEKTLAGLHTFIARPRKGAVSPGFGGYLMQSREVRLKIMTIAQGTKVLGLSKNMLCNIKLPIPHPDEQTKIANFLTALDRKIESVSTQITGMQTWKKGLLQQMFV